MIRIDQNFSEESLNYIFSDHEIYLWSVWKSILQSGMKIPPKNARNEMNSGNMFAAWTVKALQHESRFKAGFSTMLDASWMCKEKSRCLSNESAPGWTWVALPVWHTCWIDCNQRRFNTMPIPRCRDRSIIFEYSLEENYFKNLV